MAEWANPIDPYPYPFEAAQWSLPTVRRARLGTRDLAWRTPASSATMP